MAAAAAAAAGGTAADAGTDVGADEADGAPYGLEEGSTGGPKVERVQAKTEPHVSRVTHSFRANSGQGKAWTKQEQADAKRRVGSARHADGRRHALGCWCRIQGHARKHKQSATRWIKAVSAKTAHHEANSAAVWIICCSQPWSSTPRPIELPTQHAWHWQRRRRRGVPRRYITSRPHAHIPHRPAAADRNKF